MKFAFLFSLITACGLFFLISCGGGSDSDKKNETTTTTTTNQDQGSSSSSGAEKSGVGKFQNVPLTHPLDQTMVTAGQAVYNLKCVSCHKTTEEKLVGPGWKGVTDRRTPEWIMNFVTNTEEMLEKNQTAKNLYEICLVKMPNQNLSDDDARHILEFMRNNDGKK